MFRADTLRTHMLTDRSCILTLISCLDLIHIASYPVSMLAMLAVPKRPSLLRRVPGPARVSLFGGRSLPIICRSLNWLSAAEGVAILHTIHRLVLRKLVCPDINREMLRGVMRWGIIWGLRSCI